jgi:ABC-type antimicrobial peptide transport system permease subunit
MRDAGKRSSGTGGFALYGESTLPVLHDLNSEDGRRAYGLDTGALESVEFVPFRVHDGDDASCLNLNRPQNPRLLGVRPEALQERDAFTFAEVMYDSLNERPWLLLKDNDEDDIVNAIGDQNTVSWSVGKSVGDRLMYTDERGQTFYIKIVGAIANSILQGGFIISEDEFIRRFPSESGYRVFLVDFPSEKSPLTPLFQRGELERLLSQKGEAIDDSKNVLEISKTLTLSLQDVGLELIPTPDRLADFNTLQNTYLSIFQSLGGLALLLGSLGLGIVVLRNVMERRSELALLRAVGFANRSLRWLILSEHWLLLLMGLASGVISGLVAALPALRSPGADIPYASLILTLFAILFNGGLWTWLAARLALRAPLLAALRNE